MREKNERKEILRPKYPEPPNAYDADTCNNRNHRHILAPASLPSFCTTCLYPVHLAYIPHDCYVVPLPSSNSNALTGCYRVAPLRHRSSLPFTLIRQAGRSRDDCRSLTGGLESRMNRMKGNNRMKALFDSKFWLLHTVESS